MCREEYLNFEKKLIFLKKKHFEKFKNEIFLIKLSYLSDIFEKLNVINVSVQGNETYC
jgi:hypothetical protein